MEMSAFIRQAPVLALALALAGSASASPGDSSTCDDALVDKVLVDARAPDTGEVRASACASLGGAQGLIAVAVAYEPVNYDWTRTVLPVHVAWYDSRAGRVVARARADIAEDAATQVNADSLRWELVKGLGRDAAALVVKDFVLSGAMDGDNGPTWTLFVADGPSIHAVLGPAMLSFTRCSLACRDSGPSERHTKTLSLAPAHGMHHGLRDLVATLHDSEQVVPTRRRLRFDGNRYLPSVNELVER